MIVEIRTYRLTPNSTEAFVDVMRSQALSLGGEVSADRVEVDRR